MFNKLAIYNALIEKPYIKRLNNIDMLRELPFYNELSIVKTSKAFKRYARSYSIEITDSKDPSVQLAISKSSIITFVRSDCKKRFLEYKILDIRFDPIVYYFFSSFLRCRSCKKYIFGISIIYWTHWFTFLYRFF